MQHKSTRVPHTLLHTGYCLPGGSASSVLVTSIKRTILPKSEIFVLPVPFRIFVDKPQIHYRCICKVILRHHFIDHRSRKNNFDSAAKTRQKTLNFSARTLDPSNEPGSADLFPSLAEVSNLGDFT